MIDLSSDKSIYVQIAEAIEKEILNGNLKEGEQAPSTNQFSRIYNINPATAGKGLNILVEDEILYKKRGLGMFVADGARKKILKKRQRIFFDETMPQLIEEAKRLEVTSDEIIDIIKKNEGGK